MSKYILGIDNGGTMTKAAIFDLSGNEIAVASQKTPIIIQKDGYAERDMLELWSSNVSVIREAIVKSNINSENIIGVGCTGHGKGLYLWGKDNKPAYNAIASTDSRAKDYIKKWNDNGVSHKASEKTLQYPIACQPVALLAWLKDIIDKNNVKIVLIWDEFSDYFKKNPDSLSEFQKLVELVNLKSFYFIVVTHEWGQLFTTADSTWKKVNDRYRYFVYAVLCWIS